MRETGAPTTPEPIRVTALSGGVGGAKLLVGLQRSLPASCLTAVVNTADDERIYGVHVSPDLDTVIYWLAGVADTTRGWGLRDDTFTVVDSIRDLGGEAWFRLGDKDFATCIERTRRLQEGQTLTQATAAIAEALGVTVSVLPMSDDPVRTRVVSADGRELSFQHYFVKERCEPEVRELLFAGISEAAPSPGVLESIAASDVVILCPSNPLVSIGPMLALQGIRDALREHPRVVAVSPIVRGAALKGPAAAMLASTGSRSSSAAVAEMYSDLCNEFVIDPSDEDEAGDIAKLGVTVSILPSIMRTHQHAEELARRIVFPG